MRGGDVGGDTGELRRSCVIAYNLIFNYRTIIWVISPCPSHQKRI